MKTESMILMIMGIVVLSLSQSLGGIKVEMWQFWGIMAGWMMIYWAGVLSGMKR